MGLRSRLPPERTVRSEGGHEQMVTQAEWGRYWDVTKAARRNETLRTAMSTHAEETEQGGTNTGVPETPPPRARTNSASGPCMTDRVMGGARERRTRFPQKAVVAQRLLNVL